MAVAQVAAAAAVATAAAGSGSDRGFGSGSGSGSDLTSLWWPHSDWSSLREGRRSATECHRPLSCTALGCNSCHRAGRTSGKPSLGLGERRLGLCTILWTCRTTYLRDPSRL